MCLFFFSSRRRHTRSDRDWSSDVCSSDLVGADGVVWFVEGSSNKISKFDPTSGTFVEYSPSPMIISPTGLALDGIGGVWFAEHGGSLIGRFLPANGNVVKYTTSIVKKEAITIPCLLAIDTSAK